MVIRTNDTCRCAAGTIPPPFDWARVEAVRDGTLLKVQLHEVDARQGSQMIEGRFHAATADSLTLTLDDGQTRTLAKSAIHTVRGPRPIGKRYAGWIPLVGVMTYFSVLGLYPDIVATKALLFGFTLGLPASLPGFLLQRTQRIYEGSPEQLITQVNVFLTDDAVVSRSQGTTVTVAHASRVGRPLDEPIGLTDAPICQDSRSGRQVCGLARSVVCHHALKDLAGEKAFETADDLPFGPPFSGASFDVVEGW